MESDFEYLHPWPYDPVSSMDQSHGRCDSLAHAVDDEVGHNKTQPLPVLSSDTHLSCDIDVRASMPIKDDDSIPNPLSYPSASKSDFLSRMQHHTPNILPKRRPEHHFNQPQSLEYSNMYTPSNWVQQPGTTSGSSRMMESNQTPQMNYIYPQHGQVDTMKEQRQLLDLPDLPPIQNLPPTSQFQTAGTGQALIPPQAQLQTAGNPQMLQQYPAPSDISPYQPDDFLWYEKIFGESKPMEDIAPPLGSAAPALVNPAPTLVNPEPALVNPAPTLVNPAPTLVNPAPLQRDTFFSAGPESRPLTDSEVLDLFPPEASPMLTDEMLALFDDEVNEMLINAPFPSDMLQEMVTPSAGTPPTLVTGQTNTPSAQTPGPFTVDWHTLDNDAFLEQSERAGSEAVMNQFMSTPMTNASPTSGLTRPNRVSKGGRYGSRNTSKDDYLVRAKQQGMSYKEIKRVGGFREAESTLRGRYRALTKEPAARVRKPQWTDGDVTALFAAVNQCSKSTDVDLSNGTPIATAALQQYLSKIPWKQVSEHMHAHGTYKYGNATVKKKFMEVLRLRGQLSSNDVGKA
ncbi:hypothetical protein B0A52_01756 [Exophiala mesophila]|uniref:Myb-like domain-containing protein n=1 Tax=Exophiala mesophila TaxID=212818 RepID=A0A438NFX4_EXOME|nr:hypothetical protein B0A52_01756 [Exophiala mesophila]